MADTNSMQGTGSESPRKGLLGRFRDSELGRVSATIGTVTTAAALALSMDIKGVQANDQDPTKSFEVATADTPSISQQAVPNGVETASLSPRLPRMSRDEFAQFFPDINEALLDAEHERYMQAINAMFQELQATPGAQIKGAPFPGQSYSGLFQEFPKYLQADAIMLYARGGITAHDVLLTVAPEFGESRIQIDQFLEQEGGYQEFLSENDIPPGGTIQDTDFYRIIALMRTIVPNGGDADMVYQAMYEILRKEDASDLTVRSANYMTNGTTALESLPAMKRYTEITPYFDSSIKLMEEVIAATERARISTERADAAEESLKALKALTGNDGGS